MLATSNHPKHPMEPRCCSRRSTMEALLASLVRGMSRFRLLYLFRMFFLFLICPTNLLSVSSITRNLNCSVTFFSDLKDDSSWLTERKLIPQKTWKRTYPMIELTSKRTFKYCIADDRILTFPYFLDPGLSYFEDRHSRTSHL